MTNWVASDDIEASAGLEAFQGSLPVGLIATPRVDFATCDQDQSIASVLAKKYDFDHIPVVARSTAGAEQIVGLLDLSSMQSEGSGALCVATQMSRLTETNLIGAQASLLSFVSSADEQPCRLVVTGAKISGIVTLSDLQKLPVRAALFALVTTLEATMSSLIMKLYPTTQEWMDVLPPKRREILEGEIKKAAKGNL